MCPNRQTTRRSIRQFRPGMQEFLQEIDLDYYRSARLLLVHAELEELRQERLAADIQRRRKIPFGTSHSAIKTDGDPHVAVPGEPGGPGRI